MGFPLLLENLANGFAGPVDVYTAMGHGRSYGKPSRFFWRELPGILESGLWDALAAVSGEHRRCRLLITDVGNDLAFGHRVGQIMEWVEECFDRVGAKPSETIVTLPPLAAVRRMPRWRYRLMRTLVFPGCRISHQVMCDSLVDLESRLRSFAEQRGIPTVEPLAAWFGFDPIHIRRGCRASAWQTILAQWPGFGTREWQNRATPAGRNLSRKCRAALHSRFGRVHTVRQPVVRREGFTLSIY